MELRTELIWWRGGKNRCGPGAGTGSQQVSGKQAGMGWLALRRTVVQAAGMEMKGADERSGGGEKGCFHNGENHDVRHGRKPESGVWDRNAYTSPGPLKVHQIRCFKILD